MTLKWEASQLWFFRKNCDACFNLTKSPSTEWGSLQNSIGWLLACLFGCHHKAQWCKGKSQKFEKCHLKCVHGFYSHLLSFLILVSNESSQKFGRNNKFCGFENCTLSPSLPLSPLLQPIQPLPLSLLLLCTSNENYCRATKISKKIAFLDHCQPTLRASFLKF